MAADGWLDPLRFLGDGHPRRLLRGGHGLGQGAAPRGPGHHGPRVPRRAGRPAHPRGPPPRDRPGRLRPRPGRAAGRAVPLGGRVPRGLPRHREGRIAEATARRRVRRDRRQPAVRGQDHDDPTGYANGISRLAQAFHPESHGNADLVAYFFRRAFDLLRDRADHSGLIATNTIGQGDTRSSGLTVDLQARRHDLRARSDSNGRARRPCCERGPCSQGADDRAVRLSMAEPSSSSLPTSSTQGPRRPGTTSRQRGQELSGEHRPRHGLHVR